MKFPRNAKIFRGQLDVAPFLGLFFLLVILVLLASLVYTPGVRIQLPETTAELPGVAGPTLAVAVDKSGQLYFENQLIQEAALRIRLASAVKNSAEPLTLVVMADKAVPLEVWIRVAVLAEAAGVKQAVLENLPRASGVRAVGGGFP